MISSSILAFSYLEVIQISNKYPQFNSIKYQSKVKLS
jgi:hypothetical protein